MKTHLRLFLLGCLPLALPCAGWAADARCFEMRVYYAAPGKLDALQARFREHTCQLFEKHGITSIGYWVPVDNPDNKLVYMLAFPDAAERTKAWKAFGADPEWKQVQKTTEAGGRLVLKIDSTLLDATDFSAAAGPSGGAKPRIFELRTYTCTPGHLPNLLARFHDHTCKLFEKHGMTQIGYWTPADKAQGAGEKLVYILAHKSREAAAASFKEFRADPEWITAKDESEKAAGGPLTVKDGVKSEFMTSTDFSPIR